MISKPRERIYFPFLHYMHYEHDVDILTSHHSDSPHTSAMAFTLAEPVYRNLVSIANSSTHQKLWPRSSSEASNALTSEKPCFAKATSKTVHRGDVKPFKAQDSRASICSEAGSTTNLGGERAYIAGLSASISP